jgi:hypothetical protein
MRTVLLTAVESVAYRLIIGSPLKTGWEARGADREYRQ